MVASIWLTKLILAHLITDFILQPNSWVENKNSKHFASLKLYLHGLITALVAFIIMGFTHWPIAVVILITHVLIDGWKSYQKSSITYFLIDQLMHVAVIIGCWYVAFLQWQQVSYAIKLLAENLFVLKIITAFVFITTPTGILIGQFTKQWQNKIDNADSLANAGKWIGIIERIIVLICVLRNDFAAIGLLLAAKGILRFNEKDRPEIKTEYLVIGTLLSIGIAVITGLIIKY
jgi:Protein of unknown function (DUF3307)